MDVQDEGIEVEKEFFPLKILDNCFLYSLIYFLYSLIYLMHHHILKYQNYPWVC